MNASSSGILNTRAPKVGIVALNYRGWADTLACVDSIRRLTYPNFRLLVVDNASPDDSLQHLRPALAPTELLVTSKNLGFGGGNNRGIEQLVAEDCKYIWLLNNDAVADPESLSALVHVAEQDERIGAVGSQIFDYERRTNVQAWGGGHLNLSLGHVRHVYGPGDQLSFLTGASMLLRVAAVRETGLFDERYFFLWEDVDLSLRLVSRGWKLAVAEGSHVWHKGGGTEPNFSPFRIEHHARGLVMTLRRHGSWPWLTTIPIWGWYAMIAMRQKDPRLIASAGRGWWAGWRT